MTIDNRDALAGGLKAGYVWTEAKKSPRLTAIFNALEAALAEFAEGRRGPEGLLLETGYKKTPEIEAMVESFRGLMRDPAQRMFNICGCIDAMLGDEDAFPRVRTVADGLAYLKKGYGL
jgi:hypothetical protein